MHTYYEMVAMWQHRVLLSLFILYSPVFSSFPLRHFTLYNVATSFPCDYSYIPSTENNRRNQLFILIVYQNYVVNNFNFFIYSIYIILTNISFLLGS